MNRHVSKEEQMANKQEGKCPIFAIKECIAILVKIAATKISESNQSK